MRVIKFRGLRRYGGQYHYMYGGYNKRVNGEECIIESGVPHVIRHGSAEQLIGVDANGAEVYEGDKVQRIKEWNEERADYDMVAAFPMAATFDDYTAINDGEIVKVAGK